MRRRSDSTDSTSSTSDSSDDADRPTLKKRTPAQAKNNKRPGDTASVSSASELNDDPDRPTLHRGTATAAGVPPLNGLPADMHQMVAVSDAKNRPEHDFTRMWDSFSEQADVLRQMQAMAREKLAGYDMQPAPAPAPAAPAPAKTATKTTARAKKPVTPPAPPPAPVALSDESLRGYTLSYGGGGDVCLYRFLSRDGGCDAVRDGGRAEGAAGRDQAGARERDRHEPYGSDAVDAAGGCG